MKKIRKTLIMSVFLLVIVLINPIKKFNENKNENKDESDYNYITQEISYNIDVDNLETVKKESDIVIVGTIIEKNETEYIGEQKFEDESGNTNTIDGISFTNFSIKTEEIIKGKLKVGDVINIKKHGGVSQSDKNIFYLDDGGVYPEIGKKYIIFSNYQDDGTLISFGRNTVIEYNEDDFIKLSKN